MKRAPEDCRNMNELRAEIDRIDKDLIKNLSERTRYIARAAEIKKAQGLPALDKARTEAVIAHVRSQAAEQGVDPELAEKVWREIVTWSVDFESRKLK